MPKIQNISRDKRIVPGLGDRLVVPDQVVAVPADVVTSYTQQEHVWAPYDDEAKALHQQMLDDLAVLIAAADDSLEEVAAEHDAKQLVNIVIPALPTAAEVDELLVAEQARPRPRKTVIAALEQRLTDIAAGD